jgi:hypothetical protein
MLAALQLHLAGLSFDLVEWNETTLASSGASLLRLFPRFVAS